MPPLGVSATMTRLERTHDKQIYLAEEHDERPKETVKMILRRVADHGGIPPGATVCDFGCAAVVHTIVDAVEPLLANLLRWTRPGGRRILTNDLSLLLRPTLLDIAR